MFNFDTHRIFTEDDAAVAIDINVVTDNEATDAASSDDVGIVADAEEQIEAILRRGDDIDKAMMNLEKASAHFRLFKITKLGLAMYNANNQLGAAIGMSLPYYESDDLPEDLPDSVVEGVDVEVVVESISERLKSAKDAVVEFFRRLYERVRDFFLKYLGAANRAGKRLEKINSEVIKNLHKASDSWNDLKISAYKLTDFNKLVDNATKALAVDPVDNSAIGATPSDAADKITKQIKAAYMAFLKDFGFEIETDDEEIGDKTSNGYTKYTAKIKKGSPVVTRETDKLSSLGWSLSDLGGGTYTAIKGLVDKCKKQQSTTDKMKRLADKMVRDTNTALKSATDEVIRDKTRAMSEYRMIAGLNTQLYIKCCREALGLVNFYLGLCGRVSIKKS